LAHFWPPTDLTSFPTRRSSELVLNHKIPYTSAAATIKEEFLRRRRVLAVAGTHGKTTTTSVLAWVLDVAGMRPSFLIGGIAENRSEEHTSELQSREKLVCRPLL